MPLSALSVSLHWYVNLVYAKMVPAVPASLPLILLA